MDVIVEIHNEFDLEKALLASPDIIGINNRDLDTLEISIENTLKLIPKIPKEIVTISESGISSNEDIEKIRNTEINAVLIGAAFLESGDIAARVREVMCNEGKG
jgi:indole-3-glycerol phosphate synthase